MNEHSCRRGPVPRLHFPTGHRIPPLHASGDSEDQMRQEQCISLTKYKICYQGFQNILLAIESFLQKKFLQKPKKTISVNGNPVLLVVQPRNLGVIMTLLFSLLLIQELTNSASSALQIYPESSHCFPTHRHHPGPSHHCLFPGLWHPSYYLCWTPSVCLSRPRLYAVYPALCPGSLICMDHLCWG